MMKGLASDFSINGGKVERETYGTSDVALGGKGAARCLERDMFYTLALDSRERGNKVAILMETVEALHAAVGRRGSAPPSPYGPGPEDGDPCAKPAGRP